jgi:hypothetical protein
MEWEADLDDEIPPPMRFERRRERRDTAAIKVTMTVLNGPGAGQTRELVTRDTSFGGVSFTTDQPLSIGQSCELFLQNPDLTIARFVAQVIRSRTNGEGHHEVAMMFKRQLAA